MDHTIATKLTVEQLANDALGLTISKSFVAVRSFDSKTVKHLLGEIRRADYETAYEIGDVVKEVVRKALPEHPTNNQKQAVAQIENDIRNLRMSISKSEVPKETGVAPTAREKRAFYSDVIAILGPVNRECNYLDLDYG